MFQFLCYKQHVYISHKKKKQNQKSGVEKGVFHFKAILIAKQIKAIEGNDPSVYA